MNNQDVNAEHRRLLILQLLKKDPDYRIDERLFSDLLKMRGQSVPSAVLRGDLSWLDAQRLISIEEIAGVTIALLRNDGIDVADGVMSYPGIARPRPE